MIDKNVKLKRIVMEVFGGVIILVRCVLNLILEEVKFYKENASKEFERSSI